MKNKTLILISLIAISLSACQLKEEKNASNNASNIHKVIALEVLQATAYTYVNVVENGKEQWIAVPKMNALVGETYYFQEFMEMQNFQSKDLQRNFPSVYFIQGISTTLPKAKTKSDAKMSMPAGHNTKMQSKMNTTAKTGGVSIEPAKGGISIATLYTNKNQYNGKTVLIKGLVVKANFEIMKKNWFHIQDGTGETNDFDLTITSLEKDIKVGDIITFEGKIILDKDFGHGYAYDVLMENAIIK